MQGLTFVWPVSLAPTPRSRVTFLGHSGSLSGAGISRAIQERERAQEERLLSRLQLLDSAAPLKLSAVNVAPLTNPWLADLGIEGLRASLSQGRQHEGMEREVRGLPTAAREQEPC